jgi:hypothetical protein
MDFNKAMETDDEFTSEQKMDFLTSRLALIIVYEPKLTWVTKGGAFSFRTHLFQTNLGSPAAKKFFQTYISTNVGLEKIAIFHPKVDCLLRATNQRIKDNRDHGKSVVELQPADLWRPLMSEQTKIAFKELGECPWGRGKTGLWRIVRRLRKQRSTYTDIEQRLALIVANFHDLVFQSGGKFRLPPAHFEGNKISAKAALFLKRYSRNSPHKWVENQCMK